MLTGHDLPSVLVVVVVIDIPLCCIGSTAVCCNRPISVVVCNSIQQVEFSRFRCMKSMITDNIELFVAVFGRRSAHGSSNFFQHVLIFKPSREIDKEDRSSTYSVVIVMSKVFLTKIGNVSVHDLLYGLLSLLYWFQPPSCFPKQSNLVIKQLVVWQDLRSSRLIFSSTWSPPTTDPQSNIRLTTPFQVFCYHSWLCIIVFSQLWYLWWI
mmetsp:Transcript_2636/g.3604  ORF Transcript_2636/g.3604 Transcript_2636/m.3604 type:complete len:210 (-) Transcript_2636:526-1155(-)